MVGRRLDGRWTSLGICNSRFAHGLRRDPDDHLEVSYYSRWTQITSIPPEIIKELYQFISNFTLDGDENSAETPLRAFRERIARAPDLYDIALTELVAPMLEEVRVVYSHAVCILNNNY